MFNVVSQHPALASAPTTFLTVAGACNSHDEPIGGPLRQQAEAASDKNAYGKVIRVRPSKSNPATPSTLVVSKQVDWQVDTVVAGFEIMSDLEIHCRAGELGSTFEIDQSVVDRLWRTDAAIGTLR